MIVDPTTGAQQFWQGVVPRPVRGKWKPRLQQIMLVELYALWATLKTFAHDIKGRRVVAFIDNTAAHAVVTKATAKEPDARDLTRQIVDLARELDVKLWLEWVESAANPADLPSRTAQEPPKTRRATLERIESWGFTEAPFEDLCY